MEHSNNKELELKVKIAYAEKQIRKENRDAKTLEPALRKAIQKAKNLETYWNAHKLTAVEWIRQRDKLMGELALLTKDPSIINNVEQVQGN